MAISFVPVRLFDSWPSMAPMLAPCLPLAWYLADAPLRSELQASITTLVQRQPELLASLRSRLKRFRAPEYGGRDHDGELARLLLTLWVLGDPPLRSEVGAMILGYAQRHPSFAPHLVTLARTVLADGRLVDPPARRPAIIRDLTALIEQIRGRRA